MDQSDIALVEQMVLGNQDALTSLYKLHAPALLRYLGSFTDEATAEEIVQDTMLVAWRSAGRFERRSLVRTWLFAIGRRQARDRSRGSTFDFDDPDELAVVAERAPGPEAVMLVRAELDRLVALTRRLQPLHREVLALVWLEALSLQEVAYVLDVPIGTVKSRLHHARGALASLIADDKAGNQ